jgi:hypothetical protein
MYGKISSREGESLVRRCYWSSHSFRRCPFANVNVTDLSVVDMPRLFQPSLTVKSKKTRRLV